MARTEGVLHCTKKRRPHDRFVHEDQCWIVADDSSARSHGTFPNVRVYVLGGSPGKAAPRPNTGEDKTQGQKLRCSAFTSRGPVAGTHSCTASWHERGTLQHACTDAYRCVNHAAQGTLHRPARQKPANMEHPRPQRRQQPPTQTLSPAHPRVKRPSTPNNTLTTSPAHGRGCSCCQLRQGCALLQSSGQSSG